MVLPHEASGYPINRKLKKGLIPLYCQLERALPNRILTGKITPSSHFPTERHLGEEFGFSRPLRFSPALPAGSKESVLTLVPREKKSCSAF